MQILKTSEVFVPGGLPLYTYVPRAARNLEERLTATKDNLCKLVTLTGTTKSGKTVLASRVFPKDSSVWVDGGTVSAEDDLWNFILDDLGGYTDLSTDQSKQITATLGGELGRTRGCRYLLTLRRSWQQEARTHELGPKASRDPSVHTLRP